MNSYRCYFLDKGRIIGVEVLNAAQDHDAIEQCQRVCAAIATASKFGTARGACILPQ